MIPPEHSPLPQAAQDAPPTPSDPIPAPSDPAPVQPALSLAFVEGVVPTKWFRRWEERFPEHPLSSVRRSQAEQLSGLGSSVALALVRDVARSADHHRIVLYEELPVLVLPADHEFAEVDSLCAADLAGIELLSLPTARADWPAATVTPDWGRFVPGAKDVIDLVASGSGACVAPYSVWRMYSRKDLVAVTVSDLPTTTISVVWPVEDESVHVERFIGILRGRGARSSRDPKDTASVPDAAPKRPNTARSARSGSQASTRGNKTKATGGSARRTRAPGTSSKRGRR